VSSTALVTGATGQDGSYLCELLVSRGWDVHGVVRSVDEGENLLPDAVRLHRGDLLDVAGLTATIHEVAPDVIFNLGGISSVGESWERPETTARVVGAAVAGILDAATRLQDELGREVRVVQAASSQIFDPTAPAPQNEDSPIRPGSPYAVTKAYAQELIRLYRERGLFAASAILFNHESPRRPVTFVTRKITAGVAAIISGRQASLSLGTLDVRRDWGWAPDYVDAMVRIALADRPDDFVVATGESHSIRDFVAESFRVAGIDDWERYVTVDAAIARRGDAAEMRGDASRIRQRLEWEPSHGFADIVADMTRHDLRLVERDLDVVAD
jgi:GDPmannose 4,6-dehydratase